MRLFLASTPPRVAVRSGASRSLSGTVVSPWQWLCSDLTEATLTGASLSVVASTIMIFLLFMVRCSRVAIVVLSKLQCPALTVLTNASANRGGSSLLQRVVGTLPTLASDTSNAEEQMAESSSIQQSKSKVLQTCMAACQQAS